MMPWLENVAFLAGYMLCAILVLRMVWHIDRVVCLHNVSHTCLVIRMEMLFRRLNLYRALNLPIAGMVQEKERQSASS